MIGTNEMIMLLLLLFWLIPMIFFLITQQNTLKVIQPQNRAMAPGEVWLQLIPFFNFIWQFVVVIRISNSIRNEFQFRADNSLLGLPHPGLVSEMNKRPTYDIGMAYCILTVCTIIPVLGSFAAIAGLVCWITYWVQLSNYKNKIEILT
jgi:hypothetical protein